MSVGKNRLTTVVSLKQLCIAKAKTRTLSTELQLSLPFGLLRELCGFSSKNGQTIILIADLPLQSDGNIVCGAICGFDFLSKEFVFGKYQAGVFQEPLEKTTWKNSVHLKKIVIFILKFFQNEAEDNCYKTNSLSNSNTLELNNKKLTEEYLFLQTARWVVKNNNYLLCDITDEFMELEKKEAFEPTMQVL